MKRLKPFYLKEPLKNLAMLKKEFISTLFIVPKPKWKFRPVLSLRYLYKFVVYNHFKQETFNVVLDLVTKGVIHQDGFD